MADLVCAIDLGTSGCRAVVTGPDGAVAGEYDVEYSSQYGPGGAVEQDADQWWEVAGQCLRETLRRAGSPAVAALGLSAQGHSWVLLDANFRPLRAALCWLDTRAASWCDRVVDCVGSERIGATTGKLPGTWHLLPQWMMLQEVDAEAVNAARWYAMCLDFLAARLTGRCVTEPTTAAGTLLFDLSARVWAEDLVAAFEVPRDRLPPVIPSGTVIGELTRAAAAATGLPVGLPVVLGGQDQKCAALAAGIRSGAATASLGTSTALTVLCEEPGFDSQTHIPCFPYLLPDLWEWEAPVATTGGALRWLRDVLASAGDYVAMDSLAAASPPGAGGVQFQPHLAGAAAPHWQPQRRGLFSGLSLSTTTGDLIRAVLEGVVYEIRLAVEALEKLSGPVETVHVFGGGARSRLWTGILAAVLNRPVVVVQRVETAALGAAMMAAASGVHADLATAYSAMRPPGETRLPDRSLAAAYQACFLRYTEQ